MVNPCLILGYSLLDKIAGIIFIERQEIPRNIKPSPFLFAEIFDIPKISVRIDCTAPKVMPTSLAILPRSRLLSHITRVCSTLTFSSGVASLGWQDHPSSSTLSLSLLNSAAHFSLCYKMETPFQRFPSSLHEFPWEAFLSYRST